MPRSPEIIVGVADNGATTTTLSIMGLEGDTLAERDFDTRVEDYDRSIQAIADALQEESQDKGELAAVSISVAAEVDGEDPEGKLTKAGGLEPWVGRHFRRDMSDALGMEPEKVGVWNDVVAIALSQHFINERNGRPVDGIAGTLSSGMNVALHWTDGRFKSDEAGHEYLRGGAVCPCGVEGHVEAFISGNGVLENWGIQMAEWLEYPFARNQLVTDISTSMIQLIERHSKDNGFTAQEFRWTGGVALNQPFIMHRAAEKVRKELGFEAPAIDTVTMGKRAGLHGNFMDARRRAMA